MPPVQSWQHMTRRPLILVSPAVEKEGSEFGDLSLSLSNAYQAAVMRAGGLPLAMPATVSRKAIAECIRRCDGVLLTGGDDVNPALYRNNVPSHLRDTVSVTPDGGERDYRELAVVEEVFRQQKPLLAICRGHQLVNVALGGTLFVDVRRQLPGVTDHSRLDRRNGVVHPKSSA